MLGTGYWAGALARSGVAFESLGHLPFALVVAWKACSTAMLAVAAALVATARHRLGLAGALAVIVIADMFLALGRVGTAAGLFIAAHLLATLAYWSVRQPGRMRTFLAFLPPILALGATWLLTRGNQISPAMLAFPVFSALSAAMAIRSRLPLWGNALGCTAFTMSDVIFVVAAASAAGPGPVGWLVWLTYFSGLALITLGLIADHASDRAAPRSPSAAG